MIQIYPKQACVQSSLAESTPMCLKAFWALRDFSYAVPIKTQTLLDFSLHGEQGGNPDKPQGLTAEQSSRRFTKEREEAEKVNTRITEYTQTKLSKAIHMVKQAIKKGVRFDYLLVDSWFTCAELVRHPNYIFKNI